MAASPLDDSDGPVELTIKASGAQIDDTILVMSVRIRKEVGRVPEAVIVVQDGSIAEADFPVSEANTFKPGAEISIAAAYGAGPARTLFEGIVTRGRLRMQANDVPRLEVTCRDKAIALTTERKTATFLKQGDAAIANKIIGDAGLTADVDAVRTAERDQVQFEYTDWDFLRLLADRNGLVVIANDGKLSLKVPDTSSNPVMEVTLGIDIIGFDAEYGAVDQLSGSTYAAWDFQEQKSVTRAGTTPSANPWGNQSMSALAEAVGSPKPYIATPAPYPDADLKAFATARNDRANLAGLQGTCRFQGSALAVPGAMLDLKGLGDRMNGKAYISGVLHEIDAGSWLTEVQLGLSETWASDRHDGAAAAIATPLGGLQIGVVKHIHDDPDGAARIKIAMPLVGEEPAEVWARFAQPYASKQAGLMFLPEIDDEVIVGFLNDDPAAPVVLGALHSKAIDRSEDAQQDNPLKIIKTLAGLTVRFDDEKKIITLETPGTNKIVLDDEKKAISLLDQHGNKVVLDQSGITLDSASDVTIKAKQNITVQATRDASVSGMNVSAEADIGLTAKGGAQAELSSGGQTKVAGAMVMIN